MYTLYIRDSKDNSANLGLLKFLINNTRELVSNGIFISVIKVNKKNISKVREIGVVSTPVLIGKNRVTGANSIMKHLISKCESEPEQETRKVYRQFAAETVDDDDYSEMKKILEQSDDESDCDNDIKKKMTDRVTQGSQGTKDSKGKPVSQEEDAMAKYWENQEETEY
jgi:hypothetical protein